MEKLSEMLKNKDGNQYDLVIAVIARGFSDYVVSAAREAGATGATILYGRGNSDKDEYVMGISLQPEREVVLILTKKTERRKIMQEIADKTSLMEEGRGICFSIPVNQVYGIKRVAELRKEQDRKSRELTKGSNKKTKKSVKEK